MKIGSTFNHEIYGPLKITKKRYSRMGNKSLWIGVDENGEEHELDGTEKPAKMEKESPKFLKEAAEVLGMAQGPKGEDADEDYIIEAVIPRVLEQIRQPENGKDGADADVELIIKEMIPLVMDQMPRPKELNEVLVIERILSRIKIPQDGKPGEKGKDGSPDTPVQVKDKLESLKGDDRLDASAIKNLPRTQIGGGGSFTGLAKVDVGDTPGTLQDKLVAGTNVTITKVNDTLRIASSGGVGGGQVDSIVAGNNIDVDATDPANPVVSVETLTLADISDVTASAAELNVLDGIPGTLTATELGYVDGVTSAIQTQLDAKLDDSQATAFGLSLLDDADASAGRTTLGLIAGGAGDIWVEKAGDTMTGALTIGVAGNSFTARNTTDSASVQVAIFEGDRATPATNDAAYISIKLSDSAGNQDEFGRLTWNASTITSGSEVGFLDTSLINNGSLALLTRLSSASFRCGNNDQIPLGNSSVGWSDLFLASGGVINWNAGNATLTHSAGLLTSNVPLSLGTSNALTAGTIELGHASANTLSASGGVLSIEGVVIPTISSTNTLTNKRNTRRLTTTNAPGATPTTNTDNVDVMNFTGLATAITSMTTNLSGTPVDGDLLEFRFTDDGTARGITWGASFAATTVALPTTTVISTMLRVGFEYSGSTWKCIATC